MCDMLLFIVSAFIASLVIAVCIGFTSEDALRFVAVLLRKFGKENLLKRSGLIERLRPDDVEEITTDDGFKLTIVKNILEEGTRKSNTMDIREDDVFVVAYPKSGHTWMREIVWLICNNADTEGAKKAPISYRIPYLEMRMEHVGYNGLNESLRWPHGKQRLMKTHLPYEALPRQVRNGAKYKIIYVARNPKDVCVSFYFFRKMNVLLPKSGTWEEFLNIFLCGKVVYGRWFSHVLAYWEKYQSKDERIYFTTYERMKKDLRSEVVLVAKFLEKDLTESQIDTIATHCSFKEMETNDSANLNHISAGGFTFMRKGCVGDWKNYFTLNQNAAFDDLYQKEMENSGLTMTFEL